MKPHSIKWNSDRRSISQGNISHLFNNSIIHDANLSMRSRYGERPFKYPSNPSVSPSNHLELLKDSQVISNLSTFNKQQISEIHKRPTINIFKLNEGEYDNLTYKTKTYSQTRYIPENQDKPNNQNYKFQMTKKQLDDQFIHLHSKDRRKVMYSLNSSPNKNKDLATQQSPIFNKIYLEFNIIVSSFKDRKNILDYSTIHSKNNENIIQNQSLLPQYKQIRSNSSYFINPFNQNTLNITMSANNTSLISSSSQQCLFPKMNTQDVTKLIPSILTTQPNHTEMIDQTEFLLLNKQKALEIKIQRDQIEAINESAKKHPPNFMGKSELAQLAKIMMLNTNNSPFRFKSLNSVSLGRSTSEMARISRYKDPIYFENLCEKDKEVKINLDMLRKKPINFKSQIQKGRHTQGVVGQQDTSDDTSFTTKSERKNNNSNYTLSLKRQNLYRSLGSQNYLANSMKISREDHMKEIDNKFNKSSFSTTKRFFSFQPAFLAQNSNK